MDPRRKAIQIACLYNEKTPIGNQVQIEYNEPD